MSIPHAPRFDPRAAASSSADATADGRARLVRRARAGDGAAFEALYDALVDRVHRLVYVRVRDAAAARAVTQDVFVAALYGLPGLRDEARFEAWLMRIAHVAVLNHWRRIGRGPRLVPLDADADDPDGAAAGIDVPAPDADPAGGIERRLDVDALMAALGHLTDLQQQVLTLRFIADLPVADTAEVLGCGEEAVKKLQQRGLAALRRRLGTEFRR